MPRARNTQQLELTSSQKVGADNVNIVSVLQEFGIIIIILKYANIIRLSVIWYREFFSRTH